VCATLVGISTYSTILTSVYAYLIAEKITD
jgi:hypothetical protein